MKETTKQELINGILKSKEMKSALSNFIEGLDERYPGGYVDYISCAEAAFCNALEHHSEDQGVGEKYVDCGKMEFNTIQGNHYGDQDE